MGFRCALSSYLLPWIRLVSIDFTQRCLATPESLGAFVLPISYHIFDLFSQIPRSGVALLPKVTVTQLRFHRRF